MVPALLSACTGEGGHGAAPTSTTTSSTTSGSRVPQINSRSQHVLDDAVKDDAPGCSAAVGREGNVVWTGVRGVANLTTGDAIAADTVFDIASVSKQFTAAAVLLLAGAGKLGLDDPLSRHLTELPAWAGDVTLTQLMHHTSGIPDYVGLLKAQGYRYRDTTTQEQALQAVTTVSELEFPPGTRFKYSNSNYLLLGEVVRHASSQPLPQFLSTNIFRPLSLAMTMDPVAQIRKKAVSYETKNDEYRVADSGWQQIGDGAIQTTPSQLVRWADNYRTGKVGGPQLLEAQLAGAVPTEPEGADRYGAGMYLMGQHFQGTLDHDGAWAGFVTAFRVSKDRRTAVAISCNTDKQDPESLADSLWQLWT